MKLIIDIPEEDYNAILNTQEFNGSYSGKQVRLMVNAIDNGVVFDSIINDLENERFNHVESQFDKGYDSAITDSIKVVDKYLSAVDRYNRPIKEEKP